MCFATIVIEVVLESLTICVLYCEPALMADIDAMSRSHSSQQLGHLYYQHHTQQFCSS